MSWNMKCNAFDVTVHLRLMLINMNTPQVLIEWGTVIVEYRTPYIPYTSLTTRNIIQP